jgi:chromosome segregation ATPase
MTLPEQIAQLTQQLAAANAKATQLETNVSTLTARAEKAETDLATANAQVTELTGKLTTANASVTSLTAEVGTLKTKAESAEQKAVALMAQVGQPKPVAADPKGEAKPETNNNLTGLARTEAYFRAHNQNVK